MSQRIRFVFQTSSGFDVHPCSGVWGGATPEGDIAATFYFDSPLLPVAVTMKSSDDMPGLSLMESQEFPITSESGDGVCVRRLVSGIVLSPQAAMAVGEWLIQTATSVLGDKASSRR